MGELIDTLKKHSFQFKKQFGQNFIVNPGICPKMAEAAGLAEGWGALEVGPGIGVLTKELALRADKVVTVEIDRRLPPLLEESLAGLDNIRLVMGDVLELDLHALIAEEFADVMMYGLQLARTLGFDITEQVLRKIDIVDHRPPKPYNPKR